MVEAPLIRSLGFILIAAAGFALAGRRFRMPAIIAYILAGLVLGPVTGLVEVDDALELIADIGIALLLFLVGLELSFEKIRDVGKVAVAAGVGQVVFTALGGFGLCMLFGFSTIEAVFLAVALTFSSTVVVVKLLDQKGDLNSLYGKIAVGIFLVQDIVVIVALTFLAGLARGEAISVQSIAVGVVVAFGGMAALLACVLLASKVVLPRPFAWAARSPDMLFIWGLCWCFLVVWGAEWLELSLEIGAFLAGISLAQLPYSGDLRRRVHPLMSFFVAVFFVTLGIQTEVGEALAQWKEIFFLSLFVLIGNPLIFMLIISRMGYSERTSFNTSVTVAQVSEFSFIFIAMGVASGFVGAAILSITTVVGLITIGASSYMILYSDQLHRIFHRLHLLRLFRANQEDDDPPGQPREGHVIVVGMNSLGRAIVEALCAEGCQVLAIDTDPGKLEGLGCDTMIGNIEYESVQTDSDLSHASLLVSALQIEDTNNLLAYRCRECDVPCAIHGFDLSVINDLVDLEVDFLLTPQIDSAVEQMRILREKGAIPT